MLLRLRSGLWIWCLICGVYLLAARLGDVWWVIGCDCVLVIVVCLWLRFWCLWCCYNILCMVWFIWLTFTYVGLRICLWLSSVSCLRCYGLWLFWFGLFCWLFACYCCLACFGLCGVLCLSVVWLSWLVIVWVCVFLLSWLWLLVVFSGIVWDDVYCLCLWFCWFWLLIICCYGD